MPSDLPRRRAIGRVVYHITYCDRIRAYYEGKYRDLYGLCDSDHRIIFVARKVKGKTQKSKQLRFTIIHEEGHAEIAESKGEQYARKRERKARRKAKRQRKGK